MGDGTRPGFGVVSLFVARFADLDGAAAIHLDEAFCADQFAHFPAIRREGGNEGGQGDGAGVKEQVGQFADAADVFRAVLLGKAEVAAQAMPHVVSIENIGVSTFCEQALFQTMRQCRLA